MGLFFVLFRKKVRLLLGTPFATLVWSVTFLLGARFSLFVTCPYLWRVAVPHPSYILSPLEQAKKKSNLNTQLFTPKFELYLHRLLKDSYVIHRLELMAASNYHHYHHILSSINLMQRNFQHF